MSATASVPPAPVDDARVSTAASLRLALVRSQVMAVGHVGPSRRAPIEPGPPSRSVTRPWRRDETRTSSCSSRASSSCRFQFFGVQCSHLRPSPAHLPTPSSSSSPRTVRRSQHVSACSSRISVVAHVFSLVVGIIFLASTDAVLPALRRWRIFRFWINPGPGTAGSSRPTSLDSVPQPHVVATGPPSPPTDRPAPSRRSGHHLEAEHQRVEQVADPVVDRRSADRQRFVRMLPRGEGQESIQ